MTPPETAGARSKRALILTVAVESFGRDGYERTTWANVAGQVGIGQTALYHYFESKAHCLLTIMSLELDRSLQAFREVTAGVAKPELALARAIAAAYDVSPHEVLQMRILHSHMDLLATPRPSAKEELERQRARGLVRDIESEWTTLVDRGMAAGEFANRDAQAVANVLLAMVVSVWGWYRTGGEATLNQVREDVTGACLRVVGS